MCINYKVILNRKYTITEKNGGKVPVLRDIRQKYVKVPCKECYVCMKKKAREWRIRLTEDFKTNKNGKVVLLTFSKESLMKLAKECKGFTGYEKDNQIAKLAVKRFRERWRKTYGRSIRHWLITEIGQTNTERIHMHGILWKDERYNLKDTFYNEIQKHWQYGFVGFGKKDWQTGEWINYTNARTANYFTKYVTKKDEKHPDYKQIILTSAGIGSSYLLSEKVKDNVYKGENTNQMYNVDNGTVLPMPEYWRRKLYNDDEREYLTTVMLNKGLIYIDGKEFRANLEGNILSGILKNLREKNARLGFGDGSKNIEKRIEANSKRREKQREQGIYGPGYWEGVVRKDT